MNEKIIHKTFTYSKKKKRKKHLWVKKAPRVIYLKTPFPFSMVFAFLAWHGVDFYAL
jgi:hypothetical protein